MNLKILPSPWANVRIMGRPSDQIEDCAIDRGGYAVLQTPSTGFLRLGPLTTNFDLPRISGKTIRPFHWRISSNNLVCPRGTFISVGGPSDLPARITRAQAPDNSTLGTFVFMGGSAPVIDVAEIITEGTSTYVVQFFKNIQVPYDCGTLEIMGEPHTSHYGLARVFFHPSGRVKSAVPVAEQYAQNDKYNGTYLKLSDKKRTSYKFAATAPVTLDENGRIILGTIVLPEHDDTRRKHSLSNTYELESTDIRVTYNDDGSTRIEFGEWKYNWTTQQQEFVLAKEETI